MFERLHHQEPADFDLQNDTPSCRACRLRHALQSHFQTPWWFHHPGHKLRLTSASKQPPKVNFQKMHTNATLISA